MKQNWIGRNKLYLFGFFQAFDEVLYCENRVLFDHSRACITHYFLNFLPHPGFVAVDIAFIAVGFVCAKRAVGKASSGVIKNIPAIIA